MGHHPRAATRQLADRTAHLRPGDPSVVVTALGPKLGGRRGKPPATVTGDGPDELAALRDLADRLA